MAEFTPSDLPFAYDPAATAAFARLRSEVGEEALHDTAAPVKAVVIGGGTGAPVSIRTLLSLEAEVSAVVAMADDGGSTGILREEAGVLPPGDIRKCLAAMAADDSDPLTRAFKYRFSFARNHTLGNLMLSALRMLRARFQAIAICGRLWERGSRTHLRLRRLFVRRGLRRRLWAAVECVSRRRPCTGPGSVRPAYSGVRAGA
ncbi:MAG: gluconeogenesis factor YvcK family protein [Slackia sp.]